MSDIDFEELDKAVNSLMGTNAPAPQQKEEEQPAPAVADAATTVAAATDVPEVSVPVPPQDTAPAANTPVVTEPPVEAAAPTPPVVTPTADPSTSLATKRRGQFMDMKHPSADMTTATKPTARSRVGMTIAPSETLEVPAPTEVASTPVVDDDTTTSAPEPEVQIPDAPTSPFLPDAKVEKRPLGSPATAPDATPLATEELLPQSEGDLDATVDDVTLPSELHPSVLQVESDSTLQSEEVEPELQTPDAAPEAAAPTTPEIDEAAVKESKLSERPAPVDAKDDILQSKKDAILESASIPPQYKVKDQQPANDDESHASLYDAAADHPAPFDAPKKSSHLGVVIMIVALVILGAGGGAVLYLYQSGSLGF